MGCAEDMLVFGSIAIETAAPEAVSSHPSSIGVVGSELRVGADAGATSGVLFGGYAPITKTIEGGLPGNVES